MNSKKVILFGCWYLLDLIFWEAFKIWGKLLKNFLSNTGYLNKFKKSNT